MIIDESSYGVNGNPNNRAILIGAIKMIRQVKLRYFKHFREETFDLSENIILAGPNNTGKTTLLQAIAIWSLALRKWLAERGPESGSRASKRTGIPITRKDFTAIPLREMNLLWNDCSTALYRVELQKDQKLGTKRILEIGVKGARSDWELTFEFTYMSSELIYVRPSLPVESILESVKDIQVVHVPPFSGIGAEETRYDRAYQDLLIGQGKPGDILRNLILEMYEKKPEEWKNLCADVREIFGYELLSPSYGDRPFIICEYLQGITDKKKQKILPKLDISCAGSGFLQVLMLLGFFYARPASILLLDEPDAHLHVILQKQIYDQIRQVAQQRGCQLLIATHSEVLIDGTSPERIVSFFGHPHTLVSDVERNRVREALKHLTSLDLLMAEQFSEILYVESEKDLNLLREWAKILNHPAYEFLKSPFWHSIQGGNPREAKNHFFALKAKKMDIRGVLLLDADNRGLPDRELAFDGLTILRWRRYESENYLIHPQALNRFVKSFESNLFVRIFPDKGLDYLKNQLPPVVYNDPLAEHEYLNVTPASKTLLPGFFEAVELDITKNEYYQIAAKMLPEEVSPEVIEKLDLISESLETHI